MTTDTLPIFVGTTSHDRAQAEAFAYHNPAWRVEEVQDEEGIPYLSVTPPGKQSGWWIRRATDQWVTILSPGGTKVLRSTDVAAALIVVRRHAAWSLPLRSSSLFVLWQSVRGGTRRLARRGCPALQFRKSRAKRSASPWRG